METLLQPFTVADPGFPRGGAPTPAGGEGGRQHTNLPNFPKNCMKLKEFGIRGGGGERPSRPPLDPPLFQSLEAKFVTNLLDHDMAGQIDTYQLLLT